MCELMVDENLIMAFLEKHKPGHYIVENGFIFIAEDNLRGNDDSLRHLSLQGRVYDHFPNVYDLLNESIRSTKVSEISIFSEHPI